MSSSRVPGKQPLVSVIMPAYNARPYIGEAIRSVLTQDYPNVELIVVDDGSRDGTAEEARAFGERVRVFQRSNGGAAAARNFGLTQARGELIAFLDADDIWLPGKLSAQVRYLDDHPEVGLVYAKFMRWYPAADGRFGPPPAAQDDPAKGELIAEHSGWIYCELLYDSIVCIITALIRRPVLEAVGMFDESLRTGEDYEFWMRISRLFPAAKLNRTVAYYRMHPQSTTHAPRPENNEYRVLCRMLDSHGVRGPDGSEADPRRLRERLFTLCYGHGYIHYWGGDPAVARCAFEAAIARAPWRLQAWGYWLLAFVKQGFGVGFRK